LGKGERIFITAKLPQYIRVSKDDLIEKYLFLTTSHDGMGSITAAFTPIRIVCNNTLNAALKNCSNSVKIRHTQSAKDRLEQAHKVMDISNKLSEQLEGIFNHWAKVTIRDEEVKKLIEQALAPNKEVLHHLKEKRRELLSTCYKNMCATALEYAFSSPSQQTETTRGTLIGAYNAITGYFQNVKTYDSGEAKLKSLILGGTAQIKTATAFHLCASFAKMDV
jgi:phage/plasmid-like protein (TIGR03299 family)